MKNIKCDSPFLIVRRSFILSSVLLVEMRRIELLSEGIVSPTSPSAATDWF